VAEQIEQTPEPQEQPQPESAAAPIVVVKKSRAGLWIAILSLILVLVLAAAGVYFLQQMQISQNTDNNQDDLKLIEINKQINGLQDQLTTLQSLVTNVNTEMTGKDNHFNQTLADFTKLHDEHLAAARKELEAQIALLQRQLGKSRGDLMLADAEYSLTVANQRLTLQGDVKTALEALDAADQRLMTSGDAGVYKVREQIAKEKGLLNTVSAPDIIGIYGTIQHLQDAVTNLSVFLPYSGKSDAADADSPQNTEQTGGLLGALAHALHGYVIVHHTRQPINSILTPEQADFIKQQMLVRLELIKFALIQQNDALFTTSIADAQHWLKGNFTENDATLQFYEELEKLAQIPIRNQLPDISASLNLLKAINQTHRADPEIGKPQPEPETAPKAPEPPAAEASPAAAPAAEAPAQEAVTTEPAHEAHHE
jgi:uroporphyrin-III C-methyltransferase